MSNSQEIQVQSNNSSNTEVVELVPSDAIADHEIMEHSSVLQLNVAQRGKMSLFPSNNTFTEFNFSPVFRHPTTMKLAKTDPTLQSIKLQMKSLHEQLFSKINSIPQNEENDKKVINKEITNAYNKILKELMQTLKGYTLLEEPNNKLKKYIEKEYNAKFDDNAVLMKFSYEIESEKRFLDRMFRVGNVIFGNNPQFICLQEVEINGEDMRALDYLVPHSYEKILPPFGDLRTKELQSCAVTLYDSTKYDPAMIEQKDIIDKMYDLLNPVTLDLTKGENRKLNIAALRRKSDETCVYVINIHADFALMNNFKRSSDSSIENNLVHFFKVVDELFRVLGDRLYLAGDFNIMKKVYEQYLDEKAFSNTLFKKVLTPELGESVQKEEERTYDLILTNRKVCDGSEDLCLLGKIQL
jgi:hypothetical protein